MNMHVSLNSLHISPPAPEPHIDHIMSAAAIAAHRIAPLWPLGNFVAVNPFMGLAGHSVPEATMLLGQAGGGKLTRPLSFYANAITNGDILDRDIADALAEYTVRSSLPKSVAAFKSSIAAAREVQLPVLPTVADTASRLSGKDWMAFAADRISHWASHHFDAGQSVWRSPGSSLNLFAAWRAEAAIDMTPDISGLRQFRSAVRDLPANATEALAACVTSLGLAPDQLAGYFHRLFFSLGGWAS